MSAAPADGGLEVRAESATAVQIRIGAGLVRLTADDGDQITGSIEGPDLDRVTVEQHGTELIIATPRRSRGEHRITLNLPAGIDLTLGSGSADLIAEVGLGEVRARSGSGDLRFAEVDGIDGSTGSGDIHLGRVRRAHARLNSGSGDITVETAEADLRVRAASGDIVIGELRAALQGNTASGDVVVRSTEANTDIRTASGTVFVGVAGTLPAWLDVASATGEVTVTLGESGEPEPGSPYVAIRARTASGDITIARAG